jgi:hypothetical protein
MPSKTASRSAFKTRGRLSMIVDSKTLIIERRVEVESLPS